MAVRVGRPTTFRGKPRRVASRLGPMRRRPPSRAPTNRPASDPARSYELWLTAPSQFRRSNGARSMEARRGPTLGSRSHSSKAAGSPSRAPTPPTAWPLAPAPPLRTRNPRHYCVPLMAAQRGSSSRSPRGAPGSPNQSPAIPLTIAGPPAAPAPALAPA